MFSLGDVAKYALAPATGGASLLPGTNSLRDNPVSNFIFGKGVQPQPGVGGPAKDPTKLVRDPTTGMYFDPTTGTTYTDAGGTTPVNNPNVAQQVAANFQRSQAFLGQLPGLEKQRQEVYGQQHDLAGQFRDIISGKAPSIAGHQLQEGLQSVANQQLSQAASVSGPSSPLAQLAAMRNTGSASVAVNNAAAQARIAEQRDAQNALNSLLNNQGMGVERAATRTTQAGEDFAHEAAAGQAAQQNLNQDTDKARAKEEASFGDAAIKFASGLVG